MHRKVLFSNTKKHGSVNQNRTNANQLMRVSHVAILITRGDGEHKLIGTINRLFESGLLDCRTCLITSFDFNVRRFKLITCISLGIQWRIQKGRTRRHHPLSRTHYLLTYLQPLGQVLERKN